MLGASPPVPALPPFAPRPAALAGAHARLEPLAPNHGPLLWPVADDDDVWRYLPVHRPQSERNFQGLVDFWLSETARGEMVSFAVFTDDGRPAGHTALFDFRRPHRGLEIGWTWYGAAFRRTALNTEVKLLLLDHCFDGLGALRVQLKTDARNLRSQAAIERLGAVREGVWRAHMLLPDGRVRDTVMYSITRPEWPEVRARLAARLRPSRP